MVEIVHCSWLGSHGLRQASPAHRSRRTRRIWRGQRLVDDTAEDLVICLAGGYLTLFAKLGLFSEGLEANDEENDREDDYCN